jgi:hypothetical protein
MKYLKTFENMSMAKSIISKKMEGFDKLKEILAKNLGYIGKFTEYLMNENIPVQDLEVLYKDLLDLKTKQKNLDITNLKYEEVVDKVQDIRNDLSVNSLIQQFPSNQKAFAKELIKSNYNILLQASKKENISALVSKISRYKTKEELKNALKLFGKDSINDKESILNYIKSSDSANIVFQNEDILIVKIGKIEDVQKLGSDTSWCILSDGMWKRYTTGRYQYILYNFKKDDLNPQFKIGFTLNKDLSIHTAHDILDRGSNQLLQSIISENGVKYEELVPKVEKVEVTEEMISSMKRTTLTKLNQYADSVSQDLIQKLLSKTLDYLPKEYGKIKITSANSEVLGKLLNKYFVNKEFVKISDLEKLDKRLPDLIKEIKGYYNRTLKDKLIGEKPDTNLPANIFIKTLDIWSDEDLIKNVLDSKLDFLKIPGSSWLYSGDTIQFTNLWNKEYIKVLSDKLNELWDKRDWKNLLTGNNYRINKFIENYVILNYISDRKEKIDKSTLDRLSESTKLDNAYILKLPIDLSKINYLRTADLSEWSIPLIVKKDYSDIKPIHLDDISEATNLVKHLEGYKLNFKIYKNYLERIRYRNIDDKLSVLNKFKSRPRKGDKVISDNELITIELVG